MRQSREKLLGHQPRRDGRTRTPTGVGSRPAETAPTSRSSARGGVARSREALPALKPAELRALSLLAEGYSYAEIGEITGFSQTKINRVLAEGRARFRSLVASSEDGSRCRELRPLLSAFCDGEASAAEAATRARAPARLRRLPSDDAHLPRGAAHRRCACCPGPAALAFAARSCSTTRSPSSGRACRAPAEPRIGRRPGRRRPAARAAPAWRRWPSCSRSAPAPPAAPRPAWRPASCRRRSLGARARREAGDHPRSRSRPGRSQAKGRYAAGAGADGNSGARTEGRAAKETARPERRTAPPAARARSNTNRPGAGRARSTGAEHLGSDGAPQRLSGSAAGEFGP